MNGTPPELPVSPPELQNRSDRSGLIGIAKWTIAFVVVIALAATTRSAIGQWRDQSTSVRIQITQIDSQLAEVPPHAGLQRALLESERRRLAGSIPTLRNLDWRFLVAGGVLYGIGIAAGYLVLYASLITLGQRISHGPVLAAQALGHVGKYVPGKAMVVVLRVTALTPFGVGARHATVSVFIETLTMLSVGSALGCSVVFASDLPDWIRGSAAALAAMATIFILPPVMSIVATRLSKVHVELVGYRGWRLFFVSWIGALVAWLLIGGAFTAVILALPTTSDDQELLKIYWLATSAIGLAFSIGFVSLLPGGAGIRELVLTSILAPTIGMPLALASSVLLRLLMIAVEAFLAAIASRWLQQAKRRLVDYDGAVTTDTSDAAR